VGEKLNVGNVLEGSLQRHGKRVRVTAELIDARNGFRVWTETYDRELNGAFALQDEIARSVVDALKIKFAVPLSAHEQPGNGAYDGYLQGVFTDLTHPIGVAAVSTSAPVQSRSDQFTVPDYISSGDFESRRPDTPVTVAPPAMEFTTSVRDRTLLAGPRTNKITAGVIAAPPETAFNTSVRDRASEARPPTKKITFDVTAGPPETPVNSSVRDRALEAGVRTNKITVEGSASLQGFVKDAKGEPIKGADVRVESRDGKQVFSTVKTDSNGRYISQGLQSGVYRVTLLVNGAVKASIMNTQAKPNQPTQLNFDLKTTSQAGNTPRSGKHMVWMQGRTGTHIGGNWVEVDDTGNENSGSKTQTYTARRW